MAPPASPARGKGSMMWLQGLVCGALLAFAPAMALLLAVLMAPALASLAADLEKGRGMTRSVAIACAGGALAPAWHLWLAQDEIGAALALLSDPLNLVLAWGGGACAWALCQVVPALLQSVWSVRESVRAHKIEAEMQQIREEWHLDEESPGAG
jgi:hypothetical protein